MIRNYIVVAFRNILKRKLYSFINAFGLSIGIAFCILIWLFIQDDKNFDRFHANVNSLYLLKSEMYDPEAAKRCESDPYQTIPFMPAQLGEVLIDELAERKT